MLLLTYLPHSTALPDSQFPPSLFLHTSLFICAHLTHHFSAEIRELQFGTTRRFSTNHSNIQH